MPSEFLPSREFQAYQIFAGNTNVGKTVVAAGLCRAAAILANKCNRSVFYLKPIQTGYPIDNDERHIQNYNSSNLITSTTLYTYKDPVSPHIAVKNPPDDDLVLFRVKQQILNYVQQQKQNGSYFFLETAGGVHSPVMSGTSQMDFYRPLRLPTLLVGDCNLGGITTTLTSFESLYIRGYDIPIIFFFYHPHYKNHILIGERVKKFGTEVVTIPMPPELLTDPVLDEESMSKYYSELDGYLVPVIEKLNLKHDERFDRLETMADISRKVFWWPFTQHEIVKDVTVIDSAHNDFFTTYERKGNKNMIPKEMFDGVASWWTQGLGHGNPDLTLSAAHAAGRYGHVIFPESTNEPALSLAQKILEKDSWASRVFFSDNGSTAMEIALKMALKATAKRYNFSIDEPLDVLGIYGSYHGDTIGALNACSKNVYNEQVQWYEPKGYWLKAPSVHISHGRAYVRLPAEMFKFQKIKTEKVYYHSVSDIYSVESEGNLRDNALVKTYEDYIRSEIQSAKVQKRRIGMLLLEPVLMGAGGLIFVDPLFQRTLVDILRKEGSQLLYGIEENTNSSSHDWQGVPVVFDEVFAGWYRLGRRSASEFLGVKPDIVAYAKTLTGGLLPLALTVTIEAIYEVFLSQNTQDCLLHGHSYTAHPMGCSVAKTSIEKMDELADGKCGDWAHFRDEWNGESVWSMWTRKTVDRISRLRNVESVMTLGSVLAIELKEPETEGSSASNYIIQKLRTGRFRNGFDDTTATGVNILCRPLGNMIYLMSSQITTQESIRQCEEALLDTLVNC